MKLSSSSSLFVALTLLLVSARALAQDGGNSNTNQCDLNGCIPSASSDVNQPAQSEEVAISQTRCYLACVESLQIAATGGSSTVWPTVSVDSLSCENRTKLLTCTEGCRTKLNNPTLGPNACRDACHESFSELPEADDCLFDCNEGCQRQNCKRGCLLDLQNAGITGFASRPTRSFTLTRRVDDVNAGVFDVVYDVPETDRNDTGVTSFIFRVESSDEVHYLSQTSLSDPLDLSFFACKASETSVSFAAINANGPTSSLTYSPSFETCVHGETLQPGQPTRITFPYVAEDFREDIAGAKRAMINVSWERPNDFEHLTHYKLMVQNRQVGIHKTICGPDKEIIIDREATSYLVTASNSTDSPTFGRDPSNACTYVFLIVAQPAEEGTRGAFRFFDTFRFRVTTPQPVLNLKCSRFNNITTGIMTITTNWELDTMGEDRYNISEVIQRWDILSHEFTQVADRDPLRGKLLYFLQYQQPTRNTNVLTLNNDLQEVIIAEFDVTPEVSGQFVAHKLTPRPEPNIYEIVITPVRKEEFWYRRNPERVECLIDITPSPPDPVDPNTMSVDAVVTEENINMTLSWDHPSATFGNVSRTDVRVTQEPIETETVEAQNMIVFSTAVESEQSQLLVSDSLKARVKQDVLCVYVQVKTSNHFSVESDWSAPLSFPRNSSVSTNCTLITDPNVTDKPKSNETVGPLTPDDDDLPVWAYAAIGGGGGLALVALLCLVFGCCMCTCLKQRRQLKAFDQKGPLWIPAGSSEKAMLMSVTNMDHSKLFQDGWEIPSDHIIIEEEIGEGCFGMVHKGTVKGPLPGVVSMRNEYSRQVAIKLLKPSANGAEKNDFLNEMNLMKKIASGNNPHVLSLIGCVTTHEPLCLITEFLVHGSLIEYLHAIRKLIKKKLKNTNVTSSDISIPIRESGTADSGYPDSQQLSGGNIISESNNTPMQVTNALALNSVNIITSITPPSDSPYANLGEVEEVDLLSFAYQIAAGMEYLASLDIIHRDLACRNVLVGENKTLKISDFGMSRLVDTEDPVYVKTGQGRLPWRWMAIESIREREFTSASDVWSYGVTLWEIASLGGFPYPYIANEDLLEHLKDGNRLGKPNNCSEEIYQIMASCWNENPTLRFSFPAIKTKLSDMLLESRQYIQFSDADIEDPQGYDHLLPEPSDLTAVVPIQTLGPDAGTAGDIRASWHMALPTNPSEVPPSGHFTAESGFSEEHSASSDIPPKEKSGRYVTTPHKKKRFGFEVRKSAELQVEENEVSPYDRLKALSNENLTRQGNGIVIRVTDETSQLAQRNGPYDHLDDN